MTEKRMPKALTIAGSDSGGGAGELTPERIIEEWSVTDWLGLMKQLGVAN